MLSYSLPSTRSSGGDCVIIKSTISNNTVSKQEQVCTFVVDFSDEITFNAFLRSGYFTWSHLKYQPFVILVILLSIDKEHSSIQRTLDCVPG